VCGDRTTSNHPFGNGYTTKYEALWDHKAWCFPIGEPVALAMELTRWIVWLDVRMLICLDIESRLAQLFPGLAESGKRTRTTTVPRSVARRRTEPWVDECPPKLPTKRKMGKSACWFWLSIPRQTDHCSGRRGADTAMRTGTGLWGVPFPRRREHSPSLGELIISLSMVRID
jgi:hypothetical protein